MIYTVYCDDALVYDKNFPELQIYNTSLNLELNKTGTFSFTMFETHPEYDNLSKLKSIVKVYRDSTLIFCGRILNVNYGIHNEKQVTCEGELAFLLDSIQRPYDFMSGDLHTTITELFTFFITNHNAQVESEHRFLVGNVTVTDPNDYIVRSDSTYMNTWNSINEKLIKPLGGFLNVRHETNGVYIDYLADFSNVNSQKIEFGENLIDFSKIVKGEDVATAIIPLGARINNTEERLTIKSVNDNSDYVYNQTAVNLYGWIYKTHIWDDVTIPLNLKRKAEQLLSDSVNLALSIEVSAVDLSLLNVDIESFNLGEYIHVISRPHGVDSNFLVKKMKLDIACPTANKLTLGSTYSTFTEQTSGNNQSITTLTDVYESLTTANKSQINEMKNYIRINDASSNMELGKNNNSSSLKIQTDKISYLENGVEAAYFSGGKVVINDRLDFGSFSFELQDNGNLRLLHNT